MLPDIKLARLPGDYYYEVRWLVYRAGTVNGLAHCHVITLFSLVSLSMFGGLARLASWPGSRASSSHVIKALDKLVILTLPYLSTV